MDKKSYTFVNAKLIDPKNNYEGNGSITIEDGYISEINGKAKGNLIDCNGFHLAPGIIDIGVKICEPGEQHKESFESASKAAAAGGVTTIITRPDTTPPIDSPEILEFFVKRAEVASKIKIVPTAALTKNLDGKELTEMTFLKSKGAVAFSDGLRQISNSKILLNALNYISDLNGLIIGHPQDFYLSKNNSATSGKFSTMKGLSSTPAIAEKLALERDIELSSYTNVRYHADQVTTKIGVKTIRQAKQEGYRITAGTSIHHMTLNEFDISNYRTFFKLTPPLRTEEDRIALLEGVINGDIDTISSFHTPQDEESKRLPYEVAASGAVGLQTILPACLQLSHNNQITLPKLFQRISYTPAKIMGIPGGTLEKNQPADLIIFDKDAPFIMDRFKLYSKSKNTPFDERTMQGKVLLTFINGRLVYKNSADKIKI